MPNFELVSDDLLVDELLPIKLCGLEPNSTVNIRAEFCDDFGQSWVSNIVQYPMSGSQKDILMSWVGKIMLRLPKRLSLWRKFQGHYF
jgi:hypothetical protein